MNTSLVPALKRRRASVDQTLVYMDGPQVITLKGSRKSHWIAVAIDASDAEYPFLCSQVTIDELLRYFDGHVDLRYLFLYSKLKNYMTFDYAKCGVGEFLMTEIVLKEKDLPDKGFFARDHTETISHSTLGVSPSRTSTDEYVVDIDGNWEFPEFSSFGEKMSGVYSFLHAVNTLSELPVRPITEQKSRLEETFNVHPWRGGFSYVNFYEDLYFSIEKVDRLNVREIAYASPGHITLEGSGSTFVEVQKALNAIKSKYSKSKEFYGSLYQFLSKNKLLATSSSDVRGTVVLQNIIKELVENLANSIELEKIDVIYEYSDKNWVVTAKIILSYHRRLVELFKFYAEGRAK